MSTPAAIGRLWYSLARRVCWLVCKLMFGLQSTGGENVPAGGPVVLVSNHQSHLDPVLLGVSCGRPIRFLARDSLFFWPLGPLIRSLGAIALDRQGSALSGLKSSLRILKRGEVLAIFPEGTRTPDGAIGPLKPGFAAVSRRGTATLVPVAIDGAFAALPRTAWFPRRRKIAVCFGSSLDPAEIADLTDDDLTAVVAQRLVVCRAAAARLRGGPQPTDSPAEIAKT